MHGDELHRSMPLYDDGVAEVIFMSYGELALEFQHYAHILFPSLESI